LFFVFLIQTTVKTHKYKQKKSGKIQDSRSFFDMIYQKKY